jgi:hypothetical protein
MDTDGHGFFEQQSIEVARKVTSDKMMVRLLREKTKFGPAPRRGYYSTSNGY